MDVAKRLLALSEETYARVAPLHGLADRMILGCKLFAVEAGVGLLCTDPRTGSELVIQHIAA